ncbi:MAG: SdiA-regulated domain-containing protein [Bacteroidota bacterium]
MLVNSQYLVSCCLLFSLLGLACDRNPTPEPISLNLVETLAMAIDEPSGLSLSNDQLLSVSDDDNKVYRINPTTGTVVATLNYEGDDLEGVVQNQQDNSIWIVEESRQELVKLDVNGTAQDTFAIPFTQMESNHGLEGATLDPATERLYLITEKDPAQLLVVDFGGNILENYALNFALDYSGISFDPSQNQLYILSDESQTITRCNLQGEKLETYRIDATKAEGIAVDVPNKRVYVASDLNSELYWYDLP